MNPKAFSDRGAELLAGADLGQASPAAPVPAAAGLPAQLERTLLVALRGPYRLRKNPKERFWRFWSMGLGQGRRQTVEGWCVADMDVRDLERRGLVVVSKDARGFLLAQLTRPGLERLWALGCPDCGTRGRHACPRDIARD